MLKWKRLIKNIIFIFGSVFLLTPPLIFSNTAQKALQSISEKVWDLGFKELNDLKLFNASVGSGSFEPRIGRDVFRSFDSPQVYRVVDRMYLPLKFPLFEFKEISKSAAGVFGVQLNTEIGLEFIKIRGVHSSQLSQLPEVDTELKSVWDEIDRSHIFSDKNMRNNYGFDTNGQPLISHEAELPSKWIQKLPGLNIENPEVQARLDHFSELFTHSFRFPFSYDRYKKNMRDGDIVAYSFNGLTTFGVSAISIWSLPLDLSDLVGNVGVAVGAYGRHRIAVLRENERYAQVQVSYLVGPGSQKRFGSKTSYSPVSKFFLMDYLGDPTRITPFSFKFDKRRFKEMVHTYRFDLTQDQAQIAYLRAVRGNFKYADDLALISDPTDKNFQAVWRAPREVARHKQNIKTQENKISVFYKAKLTQDSRQIEILDPFGNVYSRQSIVDLEKESKAFSVFKEKKETRIYIKDEDLSSNKFRLLIWGRVIDNNTNSSELIRYIENTEKQVSLPNLLPRPVDAKRKFLRRKKQYAKLDLSYQLELNSSQLDRFLSLTESERWSRLESVFGVDAGEWASEELRKSFNYKKIPVRALARFRDLFSLGKSSGLILDVAKNIEHSWATASYETSPAFRLNALTHLFSNYKSSQVLLELIRHVLYGEEVPYAIVGFNYFLGNINFIGNTILSPEQIDYFDSIELNNEYIDSHPMIGETNEVVDFKGLEFVKIDSKQRAVLSFYLHELPVAWRFEFSIQRKSPFRNRVLPSKKLNSEFSTLALESEGQKLQKGFNEIILPPKIFSELFSELKKNSTPKNQDLCFNAQVSLMNNTNLKKSLFCIKINEIF